MQYDFWDIRTGQDTARIHTDHGTRQPDKTHTEPLTVVYRSRPTGETENTRGEIIGEGIRYFEKKTT